MSKRIENSLFKRKGIREGGEVLDTPISPQIEESFVPLSEEIMNAPFLTDIETGEIIRPTKVKTFPLKKEPELVKDGEDYGVQEAMSPDFVMPDDNAPSTYAWGDVSATGTYVRCSIKGPTLMGARKLRYTVKFWTSSSSVYNNDGNRVNIAFSWDGGSAEYTLTTRYGTLGTWEGNYDWNLPSGKSYAYAWSRTYDVYGDSRFAATTGKILMYQGTSSFSVSARSQTGNTIAVTFRSVESEDFAFQRPDGAYDIVRPATTGSGGSTFSHTIGMPRNSAYSRVFGQIPNGGSGSSPWVWDTKTVNIATTFSDMSMPTVTAARDSANPANVKVTWTAGGTTNKPQGNASRRSVVILRYPDGSNVQIKYDINLEAAGSHTFTGCPLDKEFDAFVEYSVSGLVNSSGSGTTYYQASNKIRITTAFTARVKVGGAYKTSSEAWVKVGGSYKRIAEAWVKVGGVYKRIV